MSSAYDKYVELLNSRPENETTYQTLSLSHSLFTKTYHLVFDTVPYTAKLSTGEAVTFEPANIKANNAANSDDLDQSASFTIEDLDNILDDELDRIPLGNTESPIAGYGIYVSGYDTPSDYVEYTVKSVPQKDGVFTLKCGAPDLNRDETGEVFDYSRFPSLRGL